MYKDHHISVVIPAYNEQRSISRVITDLYQLIDNAGFGIIDDIVVCDNRSTDDTAALALAAGARVVYESERGYGAACLSAIKALYKTDIVVFVDADASVQVEELLLFLSQIDQGADLIIGRRAMSAKKVLAFLPQQQLGSWLAVKLINFLWGVNYNDIGPFRAIRRHALATLNMKDKRFGWTVEMQIKALQKGLLVRECPVSIKKRIGRSKISGTFKGVCLAAHDIFSTIFNLWYVQKNIGSKKHQHKIIEKVDC